MNNLLIDIGNSDIKAGKAVFPGKSIRLLKRFSYTKENFEHDFRENIDGLTDSGFNKIGISVLSERNISFLKNFFGKKFTLSPEFINRNSNLPVKIRYSESLGNDRICSASAAQILYGKKNILVIDFGTATTFTLLCKGIITGGIISPGIKTSLNSLISNTTLPGIRLAFPRKLYGNNTENNIKAGVLYQSLFSAERIIKETRKKYPDLFVAATGGLAGLISGKTSLINTVDRYLVLKGINFIISA
ncbi:MAG: type III pantothenate kinase [Ignavibacteria bacterium]|nr:type III pantothenate kinase [Ignavibacteria bacterium]